MDSTGPPEGQMRLQDEPRGFVWAKSMQKGQEFAEDAPASRACCLPTNLPRHFLTVAAGIAACGWNCHIGPPCGTDMTYLHFENRNLSTRRCMTWMVKGEESCVLWSMHCGMNLDAYPLFPFILFLRTASFEERVRVAPALRTAFLLSSRCVKQKKADAATWRSNEES